MMIIGIDEVGRGPLAGPVGVGGVLCLSDFYDSLPDRYDDITDSKKLSAGQRERLASCILSDPHIVCATSLVSAKYIDRYGIVAAIRKASLEVIKKIREQIGSREEIDTVQLDGKTDYGLRQKLDIPLETIIQGDQKIRQISAASIIAKVERDRHMIDLSHKRKYSCYQFDRHKGYGTMIHRNAIIAYGLSDQHRKSFCGRLLSQG